MALQPLVTIHYHGTPITPVSAFHQLTGRHFCVSFAAPKDIRRAHEVGQSVLLDNGAFSQWKIGKPTNWPAYYSWCSQWLSHPTTWAIIPDVIDGSEEEQDELLNEWPLGENQAAPVWHMNETLERLLNLTDYWPRVCIGSTSIYATVLSPDWCRRMDRIWDELEKRHRRTPWIHMLRGMACAAARWPFASLDSTDVARNHNRPQNTPLKLAQRWDGVQCKAGWCR